MYEQRLIALTTMLAAACNGPAMNADGGAREDGSVVDSSTRDASPGSDPLVGTWQLRREEPNGTLTWTLELGADGSLGSDVEVVTPAESGSIYAGCTETAHMRGTWESEAIDSSVGNPGPAGRQIGVVTQSATVDRTGCNSAVKNVMDMELDTMFIHPWSHVQFTIAGDSLNISAYSANGDPYPPYTPPYTLTRQ
jgi:hypothetical protein